MQFGMLKFRRIVFSGSGVRAVDGRTTLRLAGE